ncbi:hypothetical protein M436DRAFT_58224 [Aureobasidium namibiae CBS 147.97]|uniref:Uncharacterized protein n=1 Tax=Aureobasidium namibiae CBS 147.97 TaxID=1043004 RepID=A0A074W6Q1_9PEZI|nr:uncharacterized protein M436DRAFT_58224 [Aureobasidium namibiae CBS 147.97]KEQ68563.1 hypothetical protein M436DRAFT_58224 [Aureobasidium namibiae CBS 147.97]
MHEYRTACRECETDKQRQERLARERQARADSPQKFLAYQRKFGRKPENREKTKQKNREYRKKHPGVEHLQHEQLSIRRATRLVEQVFSGRSKTIANTYTWKTHTPVSFDDKVEHHCTACHRFRFLKHWWKEKSRPETTETSSNHDRYMCSRCFANDWNLVVPETFSGRLPRLFTSPDYPPPFRKERLKANKSAHDIKKQHEEDEKENERS